MAVVYIAIFIVSFFGMEFVAWFTHKYIMHGFLWWLHKDHHTGSGKALEKNDWFALVFAIPSWLCIMLGVIYGSTTSIIVGSGMTTYGIAYFLVHEVFVHQRIKMLRNLSHPYLKALRRAHKMHHKSLSREHAESYGFLIVSKRYFVKDKNSLFEKQA